MRLAVDFHDTLTAHPAFFRHLLRGWSWRKFIITGTPESERESVEQALRELGFEHGQHFNAILMGFEHDRENMDESHFKLMRAWKLKHLKHYGVTAVFDDNPYYVDHFRNNGIAVFQTVLSDAHMDEFTKDDPTCTAHFQRGQFDHLQRAAS